MKLSAFRHLAFAAFLLLGCFRAAAADTPWLTDYTQALQQAKAENRNVLLDFTGSDWCPVCIQMEKEVFNTPQFRDYAAKNLVLLRLDFPVSKPIPAKLKEQNDHLVDAYGVGDFFPVFILADPSGKVLIRNVGHVDGGPSGFIAMLQGKKA